MFIRKWRKLSIINQELCWRTVGFQNRVTLSGYFCPFWLFCGGRNATRRRSAIFTMTKTLSEVFSYFNQISLLILDFPVKFAPIDERTWRLLELTLVIMFFTTRLQYWYLNFHHFLIVLRGRILFLLRASLSPAFFFSLFRRLQTKSQDVPSVRKLISVAAVANIFHMVSSIMSSPSVRTAIDSSIHWNSSEERFAEREAEQWRFACVQLWLLYHFQLE